MNELHDNGSVIIFGNMNEAYDRLMMAQYHQLGLHVTTE